MGISASIVVLTYNNLDYTRICLESIFENTRIEEFELIVVDNASTDGTGHFLEAYALDRPNLRLILNEKNQGFARGNNIGAAAATGKYLVFLNNDTVVTKGWLSGLIRYLQDPEVGMVGPVTNSSGNESQIEIDYQDLEGMHAFASQYTREHKNQSFEIRMLPFQCVALRRAVFEEVGPLDESFGIGMFEDDDYALRLKKSGFKIICAEDVFIHHWGSASFSKLGTDQYWGIFRENLTKFEAKWRLKWLPHMRRPEFIPQQMRQMLDHNLWLRDVLQEREHSINGLTVELDNIYQSNSWAFIQYMLRIRRFFIPEGSRREVVLRTIISALREFKPSGVIKILRTMADALQKGKRTPPVDPVSHIKQVSTRAVTSSAQPINGFGLPERFPWPKVSVILPVYNHADIVEAAARSVLFSGYPNIELIILDDGSTDNIEPVFQRLRTNPRVRIFRQPNQKLPRALTHAHQYALGEFITWTSSDNLMAPEAIEMMVNELLSHPNAVLVYADVELIDANGQPLRESDYRPQNQDPDRPEIMRFYRDTRPLGFEADNYINACFLYRREAAHALEGYFADDLLGLEDYDFWLKLQKSGRIQHLRNEEPLYYYRVHNRTMSHDLLAQDEVRDRHLKRKERFIAYEALRRQYAQKRWHLSIDESVAKSERESLLDVAAQLPVDVGFDCVGWERGAKRLRFVSASANVSDPIYVRNNLYDWQLTWHSPRSEEWQNLNLWKGYSLHPLVLKSREHRKNLWEFPQAGNRKIIGCHCGMAELSVDIETTRQIMLSNPEIFFVFLDTVSAANPSRGQEVVRGIENGIYLGARLHEKSYHIYACFDAFWLPPISDNPPQQIYLSQLVLAYAAARPFLAPFNISFLPAPYQFHYQPADKSLKFIMPISRESMDTCILDRYLESWMPSGRLMQLLKFADAATQDWAVSRPNFESEPSAPPKPPTVWRPVSSGNSERLKCALAVNSLDKGGLEVIVAKLAQRLPDLNINTFVVCVDTGGEIADRLQSMGIPVYVANGDQRQVRSILQKEKPNLVNSHWADLKLLKAASELGIPIVEDIHNMYVWMDHQDWQIEIQRSRYFSHAVAVSQLVKRYYLKNNYAFAADWISVIPNGIEISQLDVLDRDAARRRIGLGEDDFIFLNLASYDGRKNQLGLMAAFDEVAGNFPEARLLLAGNVGYPDYYEKVQAYRDSISSKEQIIMFEFRKDKNVLLSAADVFVINSFYEGWSLAGTEALQVGLPLIHSDCGSANELVGEQSERGIAIPNPACEPLEIDWDIYSAMIWQTHQRNTYHLVQAMSQMVEERTKWQQLRADIRNYALRYFSEESMIRSYENRFKDLVGVRSV